MLWPESLTHHDSLTRLLTSSNRRCSLGGSNRKLGLILNMPLRTQLPVIKEIVLLFGSFQVSGFLGSVSEWSVNFDCFGSLFDLCPLINWSIAIRLRVATSSFKGFTRHLLSYSPSSLAMKMKIAQAYWLLRTLWKCQQPEDSCWCATGWHLQPERTLGWSDSALWYASCARCHEGFRLLWERGSGCVWTRMCTDAHELVFMYKHM